MSEKSELIWVAGTSKVHCHAGGRQISGNVLDDDGRPVTGAEVAVYRAEPGETVSNVKTDTDGKYFIPVDPGIYLVHITYPTRHQVDAAVARPIKPELIDPSILGIGRVKGVAAARLSLGVQKSGRSTGMTRGRVTMTGATVRVGFGGGRTAAFTGQIITSKMGDPGDSGSLLLDGNNQAVGLLFAGSSHVTLYNPITDVLDALDVNLTPDVRQQVSPPEPEHRELLDLCSQRAASLLRHPNVVGAGLGEKYTAGVNTGKLSVVVLVEKKKSLHELQEEELIPDYIEDVPTDVVESDRLEADVLTRWYGKRLDRKKRLRPARPGLSIGHSLVSAGTFGAVVYDRQTGEPLILSNNHVLANGTDGSDSLSGLGDEILQPGRRDGGNSPEDVIGTLLRFAPLRFA